MLGFIALPVIWRGVTFRLGSYELKGGRRVAVHEFPTRDQGYTEDLSRRHIAEPRLLSPAELRAVCDTAMLAQLRRNARRVPLARDQARAA